MRYDISKDKYRMRKAITWRGKTMTGSDWAREFGINFSTFRTRRNRGWPMQKIKEIKVTPNGRRVSGNRITHWEQAVPRLPKSGDKLHPIVSAIYTEMNKQRCTYKMMSNRSGVSANAIQSMRRNGPGYFCNVEAMANTIGLDIRAIKLNSPREIS